MKRINKNDIMGITLLSTDEAKNVPKDMLKAKHWWWLRSPSNNSGLATGVLYYGDVDDYGHDVDSRIGGVRPALIIKNLESSNLQIGEKVECLNRTWFYVGENLILSEYVIDFRAFNSSITKGNSFLDSDIKRYLDEMLEKWLAEYEKTEWKNDE